MKRRNDLPLILNDRGLCGVGAEIGVRTGRLSKAIMQHWKGQLLLLVDAWRPLPEIRDNTAVDQETFDQWLAHCTALMEPYGDRVRIIRELSVVAAAEIEDGSLDFAYIDACHGYDPDGQWGIRADLPAWWPKVKEGGLFAGHDYYLARRCNRGLAEIVTTEREADLHIYGVKKAVDEFAEHVGREIHLTQDRTPSWWMDK